MLITYQETHLLNASSDPTTEGALLFAVLEKMITIEAEAMARLASKLPAQHYQKLCQRITDIKSKNASFQLPPRLLAEASERIQSKEMPGNSAKSLPEMMLKAHRYQILGRKAGLRYYLKAKEAQSPREAEGVECLDHTSKQSLFNKAKSLFSGEKLSVINSTILNAPNAGNLIDMKGYPLIAFNQRGRTAGTAYLERWEIRLNPILLVENSESFIEEVLPHEYAHLLTFALFGRVQPHGKEWQMMMTEIMGLPANRTHSFDTQNSTTRKYQRYTYQCDCKTHELTSIRHNRIQAGKAQYHCKSCAGALRFQKQ